MMTKLTLFLLLISVFTTGYTSEEYKKPLKVDWSFDGFFGKFDRQAIQRGYKVYKEVCASCHSMHRIAFRNLEDIGFSQDEIKEIAKSQEVQDGPNDEGDMFQRPALPSDYFVPPFANKQASIASNGGAYPPDLSLIVKARKDGANYVYSLLTGYTGESEGILHYNPYFTGGKLAMAPPLSDQQVEYEDGTYPSIENMSHDVVNFLQWAAEPETEKRNSLGFKVISFLVIATILSIVTKRKIWSHLYKTKEQQ